MSQHCHHVRQIFVDVTLWRHIILKGKLHYGKYKTEIKSDCNGWQKVSIYENELLDHCIFYETNLWQTDSVMIVQNLWKQPFQLLSLNICLILLYCNVNEINHQIKNVMANIVIFCMQIITTIPSVL